MKKQTYENHVQYYPPHHFVFYPVALIGITACLRCAYTHPGQEALWIAMAAVITFVMLLSFMLRQHYALNNQNRIVRLEVRFRYYVLTQQRFELLEPRLSFGQIAALRFAGDEELPTLVQRTLAEQLKPDAIKRAITNWQADDMRV